MKKMLTIISVVLIMAMMFSVSAFAADVTAPGASDLTLNATVAGSTTYIISIPSGTKNVDMVAGAQSVGTVACTAFSSNEGKSVKVVATMKTAMTNDTHSVNFDVTDNDTITFDDVDDTGKDVKITLGDLTGLKAGTYTGAMTFTVSVV